MAGGRKVINKKNPVNLENPAKYNKMIQQNETEKIAEILEPVFKKNKTVKAVLLGAHSRRMPTGKSDLDSAIIIETDKRFF